MNYQVDSQPIYQRIARELRQRIQHGDLGVGDQLPTEDELCTHYGVSRMTVRQALNELTQGGFIIRRRGLGTFVSSNKAERVSGRLLGFMEDAQAHGLSPRSEVVDQGWTEASKEDAVLLGIAHSSPLFRVRRMRYADEEPIGLNSILLSAEVARELRGADFNQSFYALLYAHLGSEVELAEQRVEAVIAEAELAELLSVPQGTALLKVTRVTYVKGGRLVGLTRTVYRGDRYFLSLRVDRDPFWKGGDVSEHPAA